MGNAVVLQDDALFNLLEKPGDGPANSQSAALIHIRIEVLDLAGPVDLLINYRAGGDHFFGFARALGVGAVAGHVKARGSNRTDSVDYLAQGVGTAPGDE